MLELQNISFQVPETSGEQKEIIRDLSLTFEDHTFIAITGPNGGGKSTLAKLIMGIEKPTSGKILFNGVDIKSNRGAALNVACGKRIAVELVDGTVNTFEDAEGVTQKAAMYFKVILR